MNKKGSVFGLIPIMVVFSFLSIIAISMYIINFGVINDYVLYEMQEVTEDLVDKGLLKQEFADDTQDAGDLMWIMPSKIDYLWFGVFLIFIISSVVFAYRTRPTNYVGFLSFLFYGLMFILFLLDIFVTMTEWWRDEVLLTLLPGAMEYTPIFAFYLENVGIITMIHIVVCLVVNLMDFDFASIFARKRKEELAIEDDEVL